MKARSKLTADDARLLALFELDRRGHRLPVTQHPDFDHVSDLAAAKCVRKVVQVLDRFVAELHQDISGFQSCLRRRRSWFYIGEPYARWHLAKIRDRG